MSNNSISLDILVGAFSIIGGISTFIFWIAARQIQDDIIYKIKEFTAIVNGKLEKLPVIMSSRFQRQIDRNAARITNVEARTQYLESLVVRNENYDEFVQTLDEGIPKESTDF